MNNLRENEDAEYVFKEYNVHPLRTDPVNDQILFGQSTNFTIQDLSEEGTINFTYDMVTSVCGFHYMLPMRCIRPYFLTYLTTYEKMNTALEGGFHSNGVYEINGPTLSGKTTLVNNIIDSNKKSKILFIDTLGTNLFIEYDEDLNQPKEEDHKHVTHVTDIRKLNDLIVYLNELKVHYDIIIIDSLSLIMSREMRYGDYLLKSLAKTFYTKSKKKKTCVIYTCCVRRIRDRIVVDYETGENYPIRTTDNIMPNKFRPIKKADISLYPIYKDKKTKGYFAWVNTPIKNLNNYNVNSFFELKEE